MTVRLSFSPPSPRAFEAVNSTVMKGSFHCTLACGKRWISEGLPGAVVAWQSATILAAADQDSALDSTW